MATPILATKLYKPPLRPNVVPRPHLLARLTAGLHHKLTLIVAPAGFGKTMLVSAWAAGCDRPVVWLSLDTGDNDLIRFLTYLVAALRTMAPQIGAGVLGVLQSPQPPPPAPLLTALLNELATLPDPLVLVLDDYHVLEAPAVDQALTFLLEHLPPQLHLVLATREDPQLPLARLRARDQLTELRARDLRFTPAEAAEFLTHGMGLDLAAADIAALETRTEGWIAGLQLAALSLQGQQDIPRFVQSFTGSHHFVLDYLVAEVLQQQPDRVQMFLLRTSILDRLCGPLCDAMLRDTPTSGQATLEYLEHANLFIVPLDDERRWYRYHHLFADLLRQRLHQSSTSSTEDALWGVNALHIRASQWYEDHGLELEAFHHAVAAQDIEHAERLIEGAGVPLHFRAGGAPILHWLASLPAAELNARPALWVTYASALMMTGQHTAVEPKLQAAEAALQGSAPDDKTRDLVGRIASLRATVAVIQHDVATLLAQSRRALEYLPPANLPLRTAAHWTLGHAYQLQGDRAAARRAYADVITISQSFGASIYTTAATLCLGQVQEADNQLHLAVETYQRVLLLAGDPPRPMASEAHLGLARIYYQWNDLAAAAQHGHQCVELTRQMDSVDTVATCGVVLARLRLAQGDGLGAVALLAEAAEFVRRHHFGFRLPEVAAAQVLTLLRQGDLAAAAQLTQTHDLPLSLARVHLAQGDPSAALAVLAPLRQQAEARGWPDEQLQVLVLEAVALQAQGEMDQAGQRLGEALALAAPEGFIRVFIDEGLPMAQLLAAAATHRVMPDYIGNLLAIFAAEQPANADNRYLPPAVSAQSLIDPLSAREQDVLRLLGTDLTGPEVARALMVSLNTLRTHTKNIYTKLGVNSRRAAVRRAQELDLL
jgi:LuxR family maltose regulon positive regulatory protein